MPALTHQFVRIAVVLGVLALAGAACAQAPDEVLAENAYVKLMRSDYEADLLRIPAESRAQVVANPRRLTELLNNLLVGKTLAEQARRQGFDKDPEVQRRLQLEADRLLSQVRMERLDAESAAEFERNRAQFVQRARETYAIERKRFETAETVDASHILFRTDNRSREEALKLAQEARTRIVAGADFARLAQEISEDPSAKQNRGRLGYFTRDRMDASFATAAFAMKSPGEVSEPVLSAFGYHLIRFEGRRPAGVRPFEEVQGQLLAEARRKYVEDRRAVVLQEIRTDPAMKVNQAAIDALRPQLTAPVPTGPAGGPRSN
jgi:peptidyl-prolyl cis-trans isomerase C